MHKFGGLDALTRLLSAHIVSCQAAELGVYDWQQPGSRLAVA
jgi:hypothetical protein